MKVLLLTVTAGQGHNQTARAIKDCLNERKIECNLLDMLEFIHPILAESLDKGYLMSTKYFPKAYGIIYAVFEGREQDTKDNALAKVFKRKFVKYLESTKPDVVVCTHVYAARLMSYLAPKLSYPVKTVGIVTDFTVHPFWEDTSIDYYITAGELLSNQAAKKGIPAEKIIPTGIPIHPKFAHKTPMAEARQKLNLPGKRTVLVMSGSMGYGKVASVIKELDKSELDFQIVSICGSNKRLKRSVDKLELRKTVINMGFTDNVDLYMDAADCIVTKPGGLTTSEALAKGLPIIMLKPIPGHEDRNAEFLLNNGAAMKLTKTFPADDAIYQLFSNKIRQATLSATVEALGKPNSAADFCEFISKL